MNTYAFLRFMYSQTGLNMNRIPYFGLRSTYSTCRLSSSLERCVAHSKNCTAPNCETVPEILLHGEIEPLACWLLGRAGLTPPSVLWPFPGVVSCSVSLSCCGHPHLYCWARLASPPLLYYGLFLVWSPVVCPFPVVVTPTCIAGQGWPQPPLL